MSAPRAGRRAGHRPNESPKDARPKQRRPDISKAKRLLGWEPKVELETGLKLSLEYFRKAVLEQQTPRA